MAAKHIRITILGGGAPEECDAGCGEDWSSPGTLSMAARSVKERFGIAADIEYIDISDAEDNAVAEWSEKIREGNLALPLLLLNNRVRISGQFDIRQLLDVIETEMEVGIQDG